MHSGIDYVDKSYCSTENKKYRLSIQVSLNGFSFCIYDFDIQKHVVLKQFDYSESLTDFDIWVKEISRIADRVTDSLAPVETPVKCLFTSRKNVLIPKSIFAENSIKSYLSFLFQLDEFDEIQYKYIPEIEAYCCFALPSPVVSKIISRFGKTEFYTQPYPVIRRINDYNTGMRIVFCDNFMDISIFRDNKLILNNSFEIFDLKDTVYFISAISSKFDLKDIPLYMSGNISNSEIRKLQKFFPLTVQEQNKKISLLLGAEVSTKYFNLLSLHECE